MSSPSVRLRCAGTRQRSAERLEDRVEDVLGVISLEQTDVQRQDRREALQEVTDDVRCQAADLSGRKIDVRHDERVVGHVERDMGERLTRGYTEP